ncbi:uncharacterized protein TRIVIDRAFT_215589 [Trichoderma virens Gv29-8]|uniref:Uncharacterized protein n=1 Tax=Hypocrea virens (strain Gv29-8 / FGSC 10586) TaxID=413071 RepID=G9MM54_HYPVG|nr:uncharacterized protein TRIVIDRAFT_215589 [Trichoderma virens Gv29-8]EHK24424.1 hypothetical protein TRIVIDRAFT_215589 [Trichoderma virens Gv29-8]
MNTTRQTLENKMVSGGRRDMTAGLRHDRVHLDGGSYSLFFLLSLSLSLSLYSSFFGTKDGQMDVGGGEVPRNQIAGAQTALRFNPFCLPAFPDGLSFWSRTTIYLDSERGAGLDYANHLDYADTLE